MTRRRHWIGFALAPLVLVWVGGAALANEYRIGRGDTVEITVLGYPDLTRKVVVNTAGEVSLPFVGNLEIGGKTIEDVRSTLKKAYADKGVVRGAEIVVGIFEYAPVYVNGDVTKPGSYGYKPGMTVRHAIALASGFAMKPEGLTAADLWGQHRAAALEAMKAHARVIRLQAELNGEEKVDFAQLNAAPSDQALVARIIDLETEQFNARNRDRKRELGYLKEMVGIWQRQKQAHEAQQENEKAMIKTLTADFERVNKAFSRGVLPAMRNTEALQALALVKARASTNAAQIMEARRQETDFERRAQRFADSERIKILGEVQDALITAEAANARLRVAREKLNRGGVRGQFGNYADVEVRIFRHGSGAGITADEGTMLQSGDVVEVRLPYDEQRPSAQRPTGRAQNANPE
jgi:polysaccharide biosynthesis/export protein